MADEVNQEVEDALNTIAKLADQSGNMKKRTKESNPRNCQ